jgi:hypothetical protein
MRIYSRDGGYFFHSSNVDNADKLVPEDVTPAEGGELSIDTA